MIRLIVAAAAVVWIALQPAATTGNARADDRTIAIAGADGDHAALSRSPSRSPALSRSPSPSFDRLDGVVPAAAGAWLGLVGWIVAPRSAGDTARMVARLWLRGQRLLC